MNESRQVTTITVFHHYVDITARLLIKFVDKSYAKAVLTTFHPIENLTFPLCGDALEVSTA